MSTPSLTPGQVLGHFRLVEEIGSGGMGVVYRAWDTRLERDVAVKVLNAKTLADSSARKRFRREALILSRLNHPNVESVYDFHSDNGVDYLVLEYVPGISLDRRLESGALPENEVVAIALQLAKGLVAAHAERIIHRDLKPGNLRLTPQNALKILDFGLAELFAHEEEESVIETVTTMSPFAGTPAYLSPEQVEGKEPDVRSDIYSAGVVLYELSTGSLPFSHHGQKLRHAIVNGAPPPPRSSNKSISRPLEAVILKCLKKDPKLRYQSASELLEDLEEIARLSGPHRPVGVYVRHWRFDRGLLVTLLVLAALVVAGIAQRKRLAQWFGISPEPVSLAVLPLQNHTGDSSLDYLGPGISEALTDDLSRVADLQVTAEDVVRRYGGDKDPRVTGSALQVNSIVDGSITVQNGKIHVPIELINVKTGRQVWGQIYEGNLSQLGDLQHQISTDVAYRLKLKFDANMESRLKRQYSTNPAAYNSYLKGRFLLAQRSKDALQQAISDFQQALDQDPQYAPAFAGMADCYTLLAYYGIEEPIPMLTKAMGFSEQALELDSTLGEAYTSRALARTFLKFDWQGAEDDYKRAIELNPTYLTAHTWYGLLLLTPLGRRSEAMAQLAYTRAADPDALMTSASVATMDYMAGDFDKSIQLIESRMQTLRTFEPAIQVLALDYLAKNMNQKVIELLSENSQSPDVIHQRAVVLGIAYARTGDRAKAEEQLKIAEDGLHAGNFLPYEIAGLYTALDDHHKALDMLELAYARRESSVIFLKVDPLLAPLRSEPRFQQLLKLMNML